MATYKTPGVYVEEITTFPPSVAEVATAVPAFIGYTRSGFPTSTSNPLAASDLDAVEVRSMVEFADYFGAPPDYKFTVPISMDSNGAFIYSGPGAPDTTAEKFLLYYALKHFYDNGGGKCYVVSIGSFSSSLTLAAFKAGLDKIATVDEPTLLLFPDATQLSGTPNDYYQVCSYALDQCGKLKDRFAVMDVLHDDPEAENFRQFVSSDYLKYGAAYKPYLKTAYNFVYSDESVKVDSPFARVKKYLDVSNGIKISSDENSPQDYQIDIKQDNSINEIEFSFDRTGSLPILIISFSSAKSGADIVDAWNAWNPSDSDDDNDKKNITLAKSGSDPTNAGSLSVLAFPDGASPQAIPKGADLHFPKNYADGKGIRITFSQHSKAEQRKMVTVVIDNSLAGAGGTFEVVPELSTNTLTLTIGNVPAEGKEGSLIVADWQQWLKQPGSQPQGLNIVSAPATSPGTVRVMQTSSDSLTTPPPPSTLEQLASFQTNLYNFVKKNLKKSVILPPSAAMAGIYARVDRDRGVWKAPANVTVASLIGPTQLITNAEQEDLNIDPTSGKSINVIRSFTGKGTLVWGARTLAGNDNEWRYISVRRLFIMIEESIQKATAFAVFEPNDTATWLKVKAMIDSFLYGLWQQGALAGPDPKSAYFVNIGLGKSMTTQDILEGRMIVEVGIAAVRPAEFIILRFSQKLQEA